MIRSALFALLFVLVQPLGASSHKHYISLHDIQKDGFVIDKAGQWVLKQDVPYNPHHANPAITICASDVTLDLNGKTLSQSGKKKPNVIGIAVSDKLTNVTIKNGTIKNFSQAGIFVRPPKPTTSFAQKRVGVDCRLANELTAKRLFEWEGFQFDHPTAVADGATCVVNISHIAALHNGTAKTALAGVNGMGGIVLFQAEETTISHCRLIGNALAGIEALDVVQLTIDQCQVDRSQSSYFVGPSIPFSAGVALLAKETGSRDILIRQSSFNRTVGDCLAFGIFSGNLFSTNARNSTIMVDTCQAQEAEVAVTTSGISSAIASGINLNSSDNLRITNSSCNATRLSANVTGLGVVQAHGIAVNESTALFISACQTENTCVTVQKSLTGQAATLGISLGSVDDFTIENCQSSKLVSQNLATTAFDFSTVDLNLFRCKNGAVRNCQFFDSSTISPLGPNPSILLTEGLDIAIGSNIVIEDCIASRHRHAALNPPGEFSLVAGFKASLSENVVFKRCVASDNKDESSAHAFGFSTQEPRNPGAVSKNVVFDSCTAEANVSIAGIGAGFDIRSLISSKVIHCLADSNGIGFRVSEDVPGSSGSNLFTENVLVTNLQFGFLDTTTALSNAYFTNRAENNGSTPFTTNYSGAIFPNATCSLPPCQSQNKTPIRFWQLPNAPCPHNTNCEYGDPLDNISIAR